MAELENSFERLFMNMPRDQEISGRFYWQATELLGRDLAVFIRDEEQRGRFADVLLDTMLKCYAMQYHKKMYSLMEKDYLALVEGNGDGWYRSYHMLFELEAFLFEMKSALDIGVKVLDVFFPRRFKTHTFGGKGSDIIGGLEQYKKDKSAKVEVLDEMISLLRDDRETWLEQAITLRDTLSHYRTFAQFNYHCTRSGGEKSIVAPKVASLEPKEYLAITYQNCIEFLQDFIFLVVDLFLPPYWHISARDQGSPAGVGKPLSQYIKFCLVHIDPLIGRGDR